MKINKINILLIVIIVILLVIVCLSDVKQSEDEFQNKGDFNISNLHKDTNIKLAKDHNVSANITEGSVESQKLRRKENAKKKMKKDRPYPKWQNADEVD